MRKPPARAGAVVLVLMLVGCSSSPAVSRTTAPRSPQPTAAAAVGAIASQGCRRSTSPELTNQRMTIDVAGATRSYLLSTPPPHQQPAPLVVDFHGYGEGDSTESLTTQFGPLGQRDGFLSVFPEGRGKPIGWDTSTNHHNVDLAFVTDLLGHLEATQCVDKARIYATGLSQGAFMTSTMACVMSKRFAAVAPVAGVESLAGCRLSRPVPILAFHGTADPILHFNGGVGRGVLAHDLHANSKPLPKLAKARLNGPGYPANIKTWAVKDGCRTTPTDTRLSPHVIHRVYPCPHGVAVQFDIIIGGGHSWPGSAFSAQIAQFVGHTTTEIDATTAIWAFFRRFHLS